MEGSAQGGSDVRRDRNAAVSPSPSKGGLGRVVAGQQQEAIAQPAAQARHSRNIAGGILETQNARQIGKAAEPEDTIMARLFRRALG